MNLSKMIDNQFVEDYEIIHKFMINVNDTLNEMDMEFVYENYDNFCIDIKKEVLELLDGDKEVDKEVTAQILAQALNNTIKNKILQDKNHESKIEEFFEKPEKIIEIVDTLHKRKSDEED